MRSKRSFSGKVGLLFLALLIALVGTGGAFAAWTDHIQIFGSVTTYNLEWMIEGSDMVVEFPEPCYGDETAWAEGPRYVSRGNWAMYTPYDGVQKTVDLIAGQHHVVGSVHFSDPVGGVVEITITLNEGWVFADKAENVKIQDYANAPSGNPSPGLFAHKGNATGSPFSLEVSENNFYGVHAEVGQACDPNVILEGIGFPLELSDTLSVIFPCYHQPYIATFNVQLHYNGTIPVRVQAINFAYDPEMDSLLSAELLEPDDVIGVQLHPPQDSLEFKVKVTVQLCTNGMTAGTLHITTDLVQWDKYNAP